MTTRKHITSVGPRRTCPVCGRHEVPTSGGRLLRHWPPGLAVKCASEAPPPCDGEGKVGVVMVPVERYWQDVYTEAV